MKNKMMVFITLLGMGYSCGFAQVESGEELTKFAEKSLKMYIENIIAQKNVANFGFKNAEEAQNAALGKPLRMRTLSFEGIQHYDSSQSIESLAVATVSYWFPVEIDGKIRTKMIIISREGKYIAGEFGQVQGPLAIGSRLKMLPQIVETSKFRTPYSTELIWAPILKAYFLLIKGEEKRLVPAIVHAEMLELSTEKAYPVKEVMVLLKNKTAKINPEIVQ
jgi:hypothetical protein